jgi:hypothetical protein
MDNVSKGGKSSLKDSPSVMAYFGLVPLTLALSSMITSSCSIHVFLGSFLLSVLLRWLFPPPRVWSLAASFSCSASPKLACLEQGVSPGVCVPAHPCACKCVCLLRNCLLPAWLVRSGTRMVPLLAPTRPNVWLSLLMHCAFGPLLLQMWAHGLWPASLLEENTGLWEIWEMF